MARSIRDAKLDTRSARLKLTQRREPYWANLSGGLALGYRKGKAGGTWIAKHYSAAHGRRYHAIGPADDTLDAGVVSFTQAQAKAREWLAGLAKLGADRASKGPYKVADAMDDYIAHRESLGKSTRDARSHDRSFIRPTFGTVELANLTTDRIRKWLTDLAKLPPRARTRKGAKQNFRRMSDGAESIRRRQSSANRILSTLKAALNRAWQEGKVPTDTAWRRVKPFEGADSARVRYLTIAEAKRLINACDPAFRKLVQAALQTGGRYGQLAALVASDFNRDSGTVAMRTRKGRGKEKTYHVVLTKEGTTFFTEVCAGLAGGELMFRNVDRIERTRKRLEDAGKPIMIDDKGDWRESEQERPIEEASARAKISPKVNFHCLRHTWASHAVMNRVPLLVVAKNLGHADTRMVEKHYGHLAPSYIADAIRAGAPKFGFRPDRKLAVLQGRA
jgi:integrase